MRLCRSLQVVGAAAALIFAIGLTPGRARADATVTGSLLTCTSFTASGTSTSPYVTIYANNLATSASNFVIVPVVAGAFSGTVSFPRAAVGTSFSVEVWGTLNPYTNFGDPGYWDGGSFFSDTQQISSCVSAPVLGYGPLGLLTLLLGFAGCFAIRRSAA